MCLSVDKRFHGKSAPYFPFWAENDMYVYKVLESDKVDGDKVYNTPFQHMRVKFGELNELLHSKWSDFGPDKNGEVNLGYHSWARRYEAEQTCRHAQHQEVFIAVIPKTSRYYVGDDGDIVSDRLVILNKRIVWPWEYFKTLIGSKTARVYNFDW